MKVSIQNGLDSPLGIKMSAVPVGRIAASLVSPKICWLKLSDKIVLNCQSGSVVVDGHFQDPYILCPIGTTITIET